MYPEILAVLLLQRRGEEATGKRGVEAAGIRTLSGEGRSGAGRGRRKKTVLVSESIIV